MPLASGSDQATISRNISELTHHGSRPRSHAQIVAIALSNADRHPHRASGGINLSYDPPLGADEYRRLSMQREGRRGESSDNRLPIDVQGDVGRGFGSIPPVTVEYTKSIPYAFGGGIGAPHPVKMLAAPKMPTSTFHPMSPSQGTPFWTRSESRQMDEPIKTKFADGGGIGSPHMAAGGGMSMSTDSPWWERSDARIMDQPFHGGLIPGNTGGRTDRLPLGVPSNSHILPADAVSGLGQGGSQNGSEAWARVIRGGPWGVAPPHEIKGHGPPSPPHLPSMTDASETTGLAEGGHKEHTSILAASEEVVVPPEDVEALGERMIRAGKAKRGESAMDAGHRGIDEAIAHVRKFVIDWTKNAPPPKK